jgi:protein involved in polysaccharide export with SLBB domain
MQKHSGLGGSLNMREQIAARATRGTASVARVLLAGLLGLAIGCTTSTAPRYGAEDSILAAEPQKELLLQAGDVVDVEFVYWPELSREQAIRPDGKVSLALVGEVQAEGLTPAQFHTALMEAYRDKITDPEINVVVAGLESHRVYVGGEVRAPGVVPITGRMTALQAVMQAGGFTKESAKMREVVVIRQEAGGQHATVLDLSEPMKVAQSDPFYLQPHDVVFVPRTTIDRVDQWVEQYINKIVPRNLHYTFSETVDDTSGGAQSFTFQTPLSVVP